MTLARTGGGDDGLAHPFLAVAPVGGTSPRLTIPDGWQGTQPWHPRPYGVSPAWIREHGGGSWGYHVKKWGNGQVGDHRARWRKGRGIGHGMRNKRFIMGKGAAVA